MPALEKRSLLTRRDGRVDYGGGLENRCGATHRGFESLSLRLCNRVMLGPHGKKMGYPGVCGKLALGGGARVVDRGRLLSACRGLNLYRGFEAHPPRLRLFGACSRNGNGSQMATLPQEFELPS